MRAFRAVVAVAIGLSASAARADLDDWATPAQRDLVTRIASAVASVEACDGDLDRARLSATIKTGFGAKLSATQTSDILYAVTAAEAVQGVQMRAMSPSDRGERCKAMQKLYGPGGSDIRGLLR